MRLHLYLFALLGLLGPMRQLDVSSDYNFQQQSEIIMDPTLKPCPNSPNCVCTTDPNPRKQMAPLTFKMSLSAAKTKLKAVVESMPRTKLIEEREHYLHYELVTPIGRFTDDVEFLFDEDNQLIHFRSASRVGYSDLWANRRRMKAVTKAWKSVSND